MFLIMNFRVSIKQILARICNAEKKKDLKVVVRFKKEVLPFLVALRRAGVIYKFTVQKKTIVLCLKKAKRANLRQTQRVLREFDAAAIVYRNPAALIFLSTTVGVHTKSSATASGSRVGGTQLFLTN
jgi:ribosomal protein S8